MTIFECQLEWDSGKTTFTLCGTHVISGQFGPCVVRTNAILEEPPTRKAKCCDQDQKPVTDSKRNAHIAVYMIVR